MEDPAVTEIIVAEDSYTDQQLIDKLFDCDDADWNITKASSGEEALEFMRNVLADVLITDLRMPGMGGLEFLRTVGGQYSDVPVILITGYANDDIAVEALRAGADSYVPKMDLVERLVETVKQDRCAGG